MQLHENRQEQENALLVSVDTGEFDAEASIDELEELAHTRLLSATASLRRLYSSVKTTTWIC